MKIHFTKRHDHDLFPFYLPTEYRKIWANTFRKGCCKSVNFLTFHPVKPQMRTEKGFRKSRIPYWNEIVSSAICENEAKKGKLNKINASKVRQKTGSKTQACFWKVICGMSCAFFVNYRNKTMKKLPFHWATTKLLKFDARDKSEREEIFLFKFLQLQEIILRIFQWKLNEIWRKIPKQKNKIIRQS